MNKTINKFLLFAALLAGATGIFSCDDFIGNTDKPTQPQPQKPDPKQPDTPKEDPAKEPTMEELIEQAKQLLSDALQDGAVVSATFTYNGKTYTASFKRVNDTYVLQGTLADGLEATLQEVAATTAEDPHNFIFTILDTSTGGTLLQVFIDTAEDTVEVKAADQKVAFIGVSVNGETVVMTPADPSSDSETVFVTGAALDQATLSLGIGRTATLTCTITPANATDKTVTWTSGDETVATVDASGKVTAVGKGKTVITAEPKGQNPHFKIAAPTCEVTVDPVAVTGITLSKTTLALTIGDSETLTATVAPDDATDKTFTWKSDTEGVATVDANGKVTAVAAGTAKITATTKDGGKTADCTMTVSKMAGSISYTTTSVEKLVTAAAFTNALTKTGDGTVTYASTNTAVAAVNSTTGEVTVKGVGSATITATVADGDTYAYATKTASYTLTVNPVAVTGITLSKSSLELTEGDTFTLTATVAPTDATNKAFTWKSDKPAVASVDENGKVTAVAAGTAKITVTTTDGGKTADCTVKVLPKTGGSLANMDDPEDI